MEESTIRNTKGQFVKGRSGNPFGKSSAFVRDAAGNRLAVADLYAQNAAKIFWELLKLIQDTDTPATARVSAIKEFNDRAFGKAPQTLISRADEAAQTEYDLSDLDTATLSKIVGLMRATEGR